MDSLTAVLTRISKRLNEELRRPEDGSLLGFEFRVRSAQVPSAAKWKWWMTSSGSAKHFTKPLRSPSRSVSTGHPFHDNDPSALSREADIGRSRRMATKRFPMGEVRWVWIWLMALAASHAIAAPPNSTPQLIDAGYHHLGDSVVRDWPGTWMVPEATNLTVRFEVPIPKDGTLRLKQRDVHGVWRLQLNGVEIGQLFRVGDERLWHYPVPATALRPGTNWLEIIPDDPTDDIAVGLIEWIPTPTRQLLDLHTISLSVHESGLLKALPARIAITKDTGEPADIYSPFPLNQVAVRTGLLYTVGSTIRIDLPKGRYRLAATRGMEWSRHEQWLDLSTRTNDHRHLRFRLHREVDTKGYIACDTHIHTFELSHHGNATLAERVLTIAGEGVELAIATDHNHLTDYSTTQRRLDLTPHFTSVVGNEVTTENGHFNAFPFDPKAPLPNHKQADWVKVVESIRESGARIVILNHPRWPDVPRNPFTKDGLNRASGERARGTPYTFDGMELVNSTALLNDPLYLFTDWFSLLNRGERIVGVGSSDTHAVDDPVGQGRTYIANSIEVPSRIQVDEACKQFLKGRASISMGIFAEVVVEKRFGMGDTVPVRGGEVSATLRVASPSWITPRTAIAFLNGIRVAEQPVPHVPLKPTNAKLSFKLKTATHDAHLVFVVLGDGVQDRGWKTYENYTLAATNPVYLDVDQDGNYRSPRETALSKLGTGIPNSSQVAALLDHSTPDLGVQIAAIAWTQSDPVSKQFLRSLLEKKAASDPLYALLVKHLSEPSR